MVYAYIRVSTEKQTTENQKQEIERFAKERNLKIEKWVKETVSGTKNRNRRLGALLKNEQRGTVLYTEKLKLLNKVEKELIAAGNYEALPSVDVPSGAAENTRLFAEMLELLRWLKHNKINAEVNYHEFERARDKMNAVKKKAARY